MQEIQTQSKLVNGLRFPLIVLVIFIHILPKKLFPVSLELTAENSYLYISEMISHTLGNIVVPLFFLFSGFYAAFNKKGEIRLKKIFQTIALPYILWNLLYIILKLIRTKELGSSAEDPFFFSSISLEHFWSSPMVYPLWYLRDLICMMLLLPIYFFLSKSSKYWIVLPILCYLLTYGLPMAGLSITAMCFFGIGVNLAVNQISLVAVANKIKYLCLPIFILGTLGLPLINQEPYYDYCNNLYILTGAFAILYLCQKLVNLSLWQKLMSLSSAVFFIYAIHSIFVINWVKNLTTNHFLPTTYRGGGDKLLPCRIYYFRHKLLGLYNSQKALS